MNSDYPSRRAAIHPYETRDETRVHDPGWPDRVRCQAYFTVNHTMTDGADQQQWNEVPQHVRCQVVPEDKDKGQMPGTPNQPNDGMRKPDIHIE